MINKKTFFLFILLFSFALKAQDLSKKILLKKFLLEIEKKHKVTFTYSDKDIEGLKISKPKDILSLSKTLSYLNAVTLFNFNSLNDRFITISYTDKRIDICGKILDKKSLYPLLLATVSIKNKGVSTNHEGFFKLNDVQINSEITVSFVGYNSITLPAKNFFIKPCKEIFLEEISEELSEVTIPKFLTTGIEKKADGSIVLNTEKFGILPGLIEPDILKTVKVLPGVESVNESISNINVRGGTNDQNLMIWDGIKMYHTGHFFGLISAYNPYLTKNVSVTKNGTSSAFSDGVSSTINMQTSNKITNKFSGGAGFNLLSADAFIKVPVKDNLELEISGRRSFTDYINTPTFNNYFSRSFQDNSIASNSENNVESDFHFFDYSLKALYDISYNHSIKTNFIHIKNSLDYNEAYTSSNNTQIEEKSNLEQTNLGAQISWNADWTSNFTTNLSAFFTDYEISSSDYNRESDQLQTQFNNVLESEIKLQTKYEFSEELHLTNGLAFNEIGIKNTTTVNAPTFSKTVKEVLLKSAFYSEIEYNNKKTYARFGVRTNYFHKFNKFVIEPRINLRQQINTEINLKLEGEFKNQTTAQKIDFEDNFLGIEKRRWILSDNKNTPIIKSKQASFGVEYSKKNIIVDITGFYKKVANITASNQGFYNNIQTFNSIGNYETKGVEFLINKKIHKISTWLSYTYAKNNYTFDVFNPETFSNNLDITHSLSTAFNYNFNKKLQVSFGGVLRSGKPYTIPVPGNETVQNGNRTIVNYSHPNTERLTNFFRMDISGSYKFKFSNTLKSTIRIGFTNITDRKNILDSYYIVDSSSDTKVRRINNYSLVFTPNLSFRVHF